MRQSQNLAPVSHDQRVELDKPGRVAEMIELDLDDLNHVSGAGPYGGWPVEGNSTNGPYGGWK